LDGILFESLVERMLTPEELEAMENRGNADEEEDL